MHHHERTDLPTVEAHLAVVKKEYIDGVFAYIRGTGKLVSNPGQYVRLYSAIQNLSDMGDHNSKLFLEFY